MKQKQNVYFFHSTTIPFLKYDTGIFTIMQKNKLKTSDLKVQISINSEST